jgi:hypothetical protein
VLFNQDGDAGDDNKGEERVIPLIVASSDPPEVLELLEEVLDEMPLLVQPPITISLLCVGTAARDIDHAVPALDVSDQLRAVIPFVTQYHAAFYGDGGKRRFRKGHIMLLSRRKHYVQRISESINDCMNLRGQSSAAPAYSPLFRGPFLPPVPDWCTRIDVESIMMFS